MVTYSETGTDQADVERIYTFDMQDNDLKANRHPQLPLILRVKETYRGIRAARMHAPNSEHVMVTGMLPERAEALKTELDKMVVEEAEFGGARVVTYPHMDHVVEVRFPARVLPMHVATITEFLQTGKTISRYEA